MGIFSTTHINNAYNYPRCGRQLYTLIVSGGNDGDTVYCNGTMLDLGRYFGCSSCGNRIYKQKKQL